MTYQILTCPNCGGRGCPTCQNTGKVRVSSEEMQKLQQMVGQETQIQSSPHSGSGRRDSPGMNSPPNSANFAGIIAFSLLSILAGGAAASWYFLKSFRPFFAGLISFLVLLGTNAAWKNNFFQLQEPDDFLKAIKNRNA